MHPPGPDLCTLIATFSGAGPPSACCDCCAHGGIEPVGHGSVRRHVLQRARRVQIGSEAVARERLGIALSRLLLLHENTIKLVTFATDDLDGNTHHRGRLAEYHLLEDYLGKKAEMNMLPMQPGDIPATWADTSDLEKDVGYKSTTSVEDGVKAFVDWYLDYYRD